MAVLVAVLGLLGLGIGLGLNFFKFIPDLFVKVLTILATVVLGVMFWQSIGLPDVEFLNRFVAIAWISVPALGLIAGSLIGDLIWRR